jgi:hypothetical protein
MSKSRKRRRTALLQSWLSPDEAAAIRRKAKEAGIPVSELLRAATLRYRLPPRKVDRELMADALYELGKIGGNINQIAYHLNAGRPGDSIEGSLEAAVNELLEWRTMLMQALGQERNKKPPEDD